MITEKELREQIREKCAEQKAYYEAQANAYRSIKRKHKKDGGDFANLKQNFEFVNGVEGWFEENTKGIGDLCLKITYEREVEGRTVYNTLYEDCYENTDDRDANYEELKKAGRVIARCEGLRDYYLLTPDELEKRFEKQALRAEKRAKMFGEPDRIIEHGAKMFDLLKKFLDLKNEASDTDNDPELGMWGGYYEPIRQVLDYNILHHIR